MRSPAPIDVPPDGQAAPRKRARSVAKTGLAAYLGWQRLRDKAFSLAIGPAFASFGPHTVIQPPLRVQGYEQIRIGAGVFIGASSWLSVLSADDRGPRIEIGDGTIIVGHCVVSAAARVHIGRSVLMARNVYIADHSHAYADAARPVAQQGIEQLAPVEIADGAWLGQNTVVTSGVRIGRGAVVGANSVVLDDVPDYSLAVGAPARVVKVFTPPVDRPATAS